MAEKNMKARIVHKHDTETNWLKAVNFTPMLGEIIVYDIDDTYDHERFKIGDGKTLVSALPFANDSLSASIDAVDSRVDSLSTLVGDTSVSEQIAAANMVYVGPTEPTDSNIKVWIKTSESGTGVVPLLPRVATITLSATNWTGGAAPYSQVVTIPTVTSATKIELNPTASQIVDLQNEDIALMAENNGGTVTIYSFGGKPASNMTMQVTLTEVAYV